MMIERPNDLQTLEDSLNLGLSILAKSRSAHPDLELPALQLCLRLTYLLSASPLLCPSRVLSVQRQRNDLTQRLRYLGHVPPR